MMHSPSKRALKKPKAVKQTWTFSLMVRVTMLLRETKLNTAVLKQTVSPAANSRTYQTNTNHSEHHSFADKHKPAVSLITVVTILAAIGLMFWIMVFKLLSDLIL